MGTNYVLNLSIGPVLALGTLIIVLVALAILYSKDNKQLKHLVRVIDVMAYVTNGIRPYDTEIVQKANELSLSKLKSAEGNISGRYVSVIKTFNVYDLAKFLYQHKTRIDNKKKSKYLVGIIESNIFEFEAEKLGKMLAELILYAAKDESNCFKLSEANSELMDTILDFALRFDENEIVKLFSEFDRIKKLNIYNDNGVDLKSGIKEETAILVRASELKMKALFSLGNL